MKDLRIVVVSWNVREELERCLNSIPSACEGIEYDVVVVDNASFDGTREYLEDNGRRIANGTWRVIYNEENRGFARACNQGLTNFDARYVLLINPDTVCPPGSLARFVHEADIHPNAGIFGPELLNENGTHQQSVRRFPSVLDQAGILMKLHHVFPRLFRTYFGDDLPSDQQAGVDQVMGACFLIRRELIEQIGGLDERYFMWFEEVDYCKQAKEKGWEVMYLPSVRVVHRGGASFAKIFSVQKQRMFNESLVKYFFKWHPGWKARWLWIKQYEALFLSWILGIVRSSNQHQKSAFIQWFAVVIFIEFVSALTIFQDTWNAIATISVGFIVGMVAWRRPTLGLAILFLELLIGSKGYLLQIWGWPGTFSLRTIIFATFIAGWFFNFLKYSDVKRLFSEFWKRKEWVFLLIIVIYGFVLGYVSENEYLFADANAWGFLLLLFPILDLVTRDAKALRSDVLPVLLVGPMWLAVKTIGLEYLFSHGFPSVSPEAYLWVRRTGVGEVTLMTANAFRIFMQSYIYCIPALLIGIAWMFREKIEDHKLQIIDLWLVATFVVLGISLSRSIWIGCFAGLLILGWFYRKYLLTSWKLMVRILLNGVIALVIIFVTLAFPLPPVDYASLGELFASRASTVDAAAVSRWNLLPVVFGKIKEAPIMGHGFGASVTYETKDPRILTTNPDGLYTTYAFEWGWLEHWVKFGILGFGIMIYLIWSLLSRIRALKGPKWLVYGSFAALVGIAVTHVFSPYFNHPLGLGSLILIEGLLLSVHQQTQTRD